MSNFNSIEEVTGKIKNIFSGTTNKKQIITLYAFNGTGKTRISTEFEKLNFNEDEEELENKKVLCYNAFLEDLFHWDNENNILEFKNSWERELINEQGLDGQIIDNFKRFLNTKTEPNIDLETGEITFSISSGNDENQPNIKISRGEESIFIWSVFYTILDLIIEELNMNKENRSLRIFDNLEYIVIDDPVSSIDDTRIVYLAKKIYELLFKSSNNKLKFLITTHHALFYSVLYNNFNNSYNKREYNYEYKGQILSKNSVNIFTLEYQNDSPFGYHLLVKEEIQRAIENGDIQKYHFNLFRGLLEKTSNFLGIKNWRELINENNEDNEVIDLINLYSHARLSELEYRELNEDEKNLFINKFNNFIGKFNFN